MSKKPILCLDFDGVLHAYTSGWQGVDVIPDGPVPGATAFVVAAVEHFKVAIHSSRSNSFSGRMAMYGKIRDWLDETHPDVAAVVHQQIYFPEHKPPALVSIDDRALTFDGTWPDVADLLAFKPWNKRPAVEQPTTAAAPATPGDVVLAEVRRIYRNAYDETYKGNGRVHGSAHDAGLRAVCDYACGVTVSYGPGILTERTPEGTWTVWWQGSNPVRGDYVMTLRKDGVTYDRQLAFIRSDMGDPHAGERHEQAHALVDAHNVEVAGLHCEIEALRAQLEDRPDGRDGNLYAFAQQELAYLRSPSDGPDEMQDAIEKCVLDIVATFAAQGHGGSSAPYVVAVLKKVLMFEPLGPLTGGDEEWTEVGNGEDMRWQSKRCPSVFKRADGTAYHGDAVVHRYPDGSCCTGSYSRVDIEFPYTPKHTYVDVDEKGVPLAKARVVAPGDISGETDAEDEMTKVHEAEQQAEDEASQG